MPRARRRLRRGARASCASGGLRARRWRRAWRRRARICSPSRGFRRANGSRRERPMRSSACMRSSSGASRRRRFCPVPRRLRCCSGHCWPQGRSPCAKSTAGPRLPSQSLRSHLTWRPDQVALSCRRRQQANSNTIRDSTSWSRSARPPAVRARASVRDSDRIIGLLDSKTEKAENGEQIDKHLLLTRYDPIRAERGEMLKVDDVLEILSIPLLGIIPESQEVLRASNLGQPVTISNAASAPARAYADAVRRLKGETVELTIPSDRKSFFGALFARRAA